MIPISIVVSGGEIFHKNTNKKIPLYSHCWALSLPSVNFFFLLLPFIIIIARLEGLLRRFFSIHWSSSGGAISPQVHFLSPFLCNQTAFFQYNCQICPAMMVSQVASSVFSFSFFCFSSVLCNVILFIIILSSGIQNRFFIF